MYEAELAVALEAATLAGVYLLKEYADFQPMPNAPASISTAADKGSQEIILRHILSRFPNDAVCAEETTATLGDRPHTGDRLWIVDPIDGTRGFAMKNGEFSVMIAFVGNGRIVVGVVDQPAAGRRTYASLGSGCWRKDTGMAQSERCRVTDVADLEQSTLTQSRSRTVGKKLRWVEALGPAKVIESYSAGIKLALVARGEADIYLNTYDAFSDWDICAGHILVTEAGGRVTGTDGAELRYGLAGAVQSHGLLATNGRLHEAAFAKIRGA